MHGMDNILSVIWRVLEIFTIRAKHSCYWDFPKPDIIDDDDDDDGNVGSFRNGISAFTENNLFILCAVCGFCLG